MAWVLVKKGQGIRRDDAAGLQSDEPGEVYGVVLDGAWRRGVRQQFELRETLFMFTPENAVLVKAQADKAQNALVVLSAMLGGDPGAQS